MDAEEAEKYWDMITRIEAQEMLLRLKVADWPHQKNEKRSSLYRDLNRQAYPNRETMSLEDYIKQTGGALGG